MALVLALASLAASFSSLVGGLARSDMYLFGVGFVCIRVRVWMWVGGGGGASNGICRAKQCKRKAGRRTDRYIDGRMTHKND